MGRKRTVVKWRSAASRRLQELAGGSRSVEESVPIVVDQLLTGLDYPPTDLDALCSRLNVSTVVAEDLPYAGELRPEGDTFQIVYSSMLPRMRRRFTIAHELAHIVLQTTGPRTPKHGRELERICDMIATECLMPRGMFLQHTSEALSARRLLQLASTFQTSLAATAIRLAELREVSAFEVKGDVVRWGYGFVRSGPVKGIDTEFRDHVYQGVSDGPGEVSVYYRHKENTKEWKLSWQPLKQKGHRLFLISPLDNGTPNGALYFDPSRSLSRTVSREP